MTPTILFKSKEECREVLATATEFLRDWQRSLLHTDDCACKDCEAAANVAEAEYLLRD